MAVYQPLCLVWPGVCGSAGRLQWDRTSSCASREVRRYYRIILSQQKSCNHMCKVDRF